MAGGYNWRMMQTPAATFYTDPARLHVEQEQVFARSWQLVGHVDQLENPGDYFTTRLGREPLLFTNDGGTIRGFFNVCRHRAGPVAQGCGRAQRLSCRYHGWTYDLSGQLLRATEMEGADFDPAKIRLQSVAVHRFGPLLFAALDPATPSFDSLFPGVTERCAPLALERMRYVTTRNYPVNANWKAYVDNYLEGYHGGASGDGQAYYYWLYPNLMLNIYEGQLQTNVVIPVDVDHTIVRFDWFSPEPVPDPETNERWRELTHFSEMVQAEDAGICETVQFNFGSRAYRPGPYSPKRESGVRLFHSLMNAWE